jgi:copper chaperone NosL
MIVSDVHFAAQIVAAGEEPLFFDDLGCLRDYLRQQPLAGDAVAYVADHRTGAWVPARSALYTRLARGTTPMGGGMIAHAGESSRHEDPAATGGTALPASAVLAARGDKR